VDDHRHALRQQQGGEEVALLLGTTRQHRRVVAGALDATVVGAVVRLPVVVVLTVRFVVLVVVGDEIGEREPVVRSHEVDRRHRQPAVVLVQIRRPREP
jgi:hypothetical protein